MVPGVIRSARKRLLLLGLACGLLLLAAPRGGAAPARDPGPFWPLVVGHLGQPYADAFPQGASYALVQGRLPLGLVLGQGGAVTGTPQETGTFAATLQAVEASGRRYPVRTSITVRRADESDVPASASTFGAGPYAVDAEDLVIGVTSSFDQASFATRVRVYRPRGATGRRPLLLHHRGRGFDHDSYDVLLGRIASHGIAVASVQDRLSFAGASFYASSDTYDFSRPELGMQSASSVLEAVCDALLERADDPQDAFAGAFDPENLFWAGHSRGGGAVHASHERSFFLRLKGLIYLMAFDLRYFRECRPPGFAPAYPIFDRSPRTPSLIIAAENDGDLVYPIADQLIDRASGPTTQVTLYGAVHNLISDEHGAEGNARITRATEQTRTADWIVCFVKRWAEGRAELDRRLYLGGHQSSSAYAVTSWQPSARTRVLEDAQDASAGTNLVGRNLVAGLRRSERSHYPEVGDMASLGLRHVALDPVDEVSVWRVGATPALDARAQSRLVMRLAQTGTRGWSGVGVWVRLVDTAGGVAWCRVWEPQQQGGLLPTWANDSPHDRFIDVHLPWSLFADATAPGLDRSRLAGVDVVLVVRNAARVDQVMVDQVRLE